MYFILLIAIAMGQSMDQYITQSSGVELVTCDQSSTLLCNLCATNSAYKITDLDEFWIEDQLKSTCTKLQDLLSEFSSYVEAGSYFIALGNLTACVSASYPSKVEFEELYSDILSLQYSPISHPEIFQYKPTLQTIAAKANNGAGSGHYYTDLQLFYNDKSYYTLNSGVNLELTNYTELLKYQEGTVLYQGEAQLKGEMYAPFSIEIDYDREKYENFYVILDVNSRYQLGEWVDSLWPEGECSQVESPRGLNSIQILPVPHTNIIFNKQGEAMSMDSMISYVNVPDFALAPGMKIKNVSGALYIGQESCLLDVVGDWLANNDTFELKIHTYKEAHFNATAYLKNDDESMTVSELERLLSSLYFDAKPIIPRYKEDATKLYQLLYPTSLIKPRLDFYFEPEVSIRVHSSSSIYSKEDSSLDMFIGRVEGAVESVLILTSISSDALKSLESNLYKIETTGLTLHSHLIISSTASMNISTLPAYIYNSNSLPYEYQAGVFLRSKVKQNSDCEYNELCSIYDMNSLEPKEAVVMSEYYPSRFIFSGEIGDITLSKDIQLVDNNIKLPINPDESVYISGKFDLEGDSKDTLSFIYNITQISGDAFMTAKLQQEWVSAFDIENLEVYSLTLHADLDSEGEFHSSSMKGYASLGCVELDNAWPGEIIVSMSPANYSLNYFTMELKPNSYLDSLCAVANITEPSNLASALEFSAGAVLDYSLEDHENVQAGYSLSANVKYLDIPAYLEYHSSELNSAFYATLELPDFTMAYGNIKVYADDNEKISGVINAENNSSYGYMTGNVSLIGMKDRINLRLSDDLFSFDISGFPFGGIFEMGFNATAEFYTKIDTALFTLNGMLSHANVTKLENDTRTNIQNWIDAGVSVLEDIEAQIKEQNDTVNYLEQELCTQPCPKKLTCISEPYKQCIEYAVTTQCVSSKTGCSNIDLFCIDEETSCQSYSSRCIKYDKKLPNVCAEYESVCDSYITVCKQYNATCTDYIEGGCSRYEYIEHEDDCINYEFKCENSDIEDVSCTSKCEHNQDKYEYALSNLKRLKNWNRQTRDDLGGFRYLKYIISGSLFNITAHSSTYNIRSSGIGPRDLSMHFEYEIPDLNSFNGTTANSTITWNFFDYVEVLNSLTQQVKEDIIQFSNAKLSEDLSTKQPQEVAYENMN
jgi:hypothetical protein